MNRKIFMTSVFACLLLLIFPQTNAANELLQNDNKSDRIRWIINNMKEGLAIDTDSFPDMIRRVDNYAATENDASVASLLYSMAAEMYLRYYELNRWDISQRTKIVGYMPTDIREWTDNIFTDNIRSRVESSLKLAENVQQMPAELFNDILYTEGKLNSGRQTFYDFIAGRAIAIQPSDSIYLAWISYLRSREDAGVALTLELDYLQYKLHNRGLTQKKYEATLDSLLHLYGESEYSVEILSRIIDVYMSVKGGDDSVRTKVYELCRQTIERFPDYERIGLIKNHFNNIQQPFMQAEGKKTAYPGRKYEIKLRYRNIHEIKIIVYKSLRQPTALLTYRDGSMTLGEQVKELKIELPLRNSYSLLDTVITIAAGSETGLYECVITSPDAEVKADCLFSVSRLAMFARPFYNGGQEVFVTDFISGKPVGGAMVHFYNYNDGTIDQTGEVRTGKDGDAVIPDGKSLRGYRATVTGDTASLASYIYARWSEDISELSEPVINLFTDRGIYRPGQVVRFKGIVHTRGEKPVAVKGRTLKVRLCDTNYKEVAVKQFTTNEYGSFSGEFTLPRQTLTGGFTITAENGTANIQVEEYKRPGFRVDMVDIDKEIAFGDKVVIKGKATTFSGVALSSGDVSYHIIRKPVLMRYYGYGEDIVAEGKTAISDGAFAFGFVADKENDAPMIAYNLYEVIVTVTDSKGESQEARYSFQVGDRSVILTANMPDKVNKETTEITINASSLNGSNVTLEGEYDIYLLNDSGDKELNLLAKGSFTTGKSLEKGLMSKLPSARVRLHYRVKDTKGRDVSGSEDFVIYGEKDKRPPVHVPTWLVKENQECGEDGRADIVFGTSFKGVYLMYELFDGEKLILRKRFKMNNENRIFPVTLPEGSKAVSAVFSFVKEGELYSVKTNILKKEVDRSIRLKPVIFRDKLLPGSSENWTFQLSDANALPVSADVMAGMYDASLDRIQMFEWMFSPVVNRSLLSRYFNAGEGMRSWYVADAMQMKAAQIPERQTLHLKWDGALDAISTSMMIKGQMMRYSSAGVGVYEKGGDVLNDEEAGAAKETMGMYYSLPDKLDAVAEYREESRAQIREDFSETSFFFPSLRTDKDGNLTVNFTLPESNTTWKMQALAHTQDMKYGSYKAEIISQKPLMISPNMPRFIRQGDMTEISTQITNMTEAAVSGDVRMELFNPANDELTEKLEKIAFTVEAKGTVTVRWTVHIDGGESLTGCRIVAESDAGGDGEQHLLPILPDRILMTEAQPFYLTGEGEKRLQLPSSVIKENVEVAATVELSANPVWYAVQALPTLVDGRGDDMVSKFATYFGNSMAAFIVRSNPQVKRMVKLWATDSGESSDSFVSQLEKNSELKDILLEETPWLTAAGKEREQRERITTVLDENRIAQLKNDAMQVMSGEQLHNGGWGWFKGMQASRDITLYVLNGMAQLRRLGEEYGENEKAMMIRALSFVDEEIRKDYEMLQKNNDKLSVYIPTQSQISYLYIRSMYRDVPVSAPALTAIKYYTGQIEKLWLKASLQGKAEIGMTMINNGNKAVAGEIAGWLRKTATVASDKGMYWANNRRNGSSTVSPIEVHCMIMNLFHELNGSAGEVEKMKQWLLLQKQTQMWESTPATANALYSLLLYGSNWTAENNSLSIRWGDITLDTSHGEAATGYIKSRIEGKHIEKNSPVNIVKKGNAPAWGAIYRQYLAPLSIAENGSSALSIEKQMFVETGAGKMEVVSEGRQFRVGDKVIIRLVVRADRDYDFVCLKDLHAGCLESTSAISGVRNIGRLYPYVSSTDFSENFFIEHLPSGVHVVEYSAYASRIGIYSGGIASIQCLYAPEFVARSSGKNIKVIEK